MLMTAPEVVPGLDSRTVSILLGVSYRQLDYAIRCVDELGSLPSMSGGSGSRRRFDVDTLRRLDVAARLAEADPAGVSNRPGRGLWVAAVAAVVAGPTPPVAGFAVLRPSPETGIVYTKTLRVRDFPVGPVGAVVRYDLARTRLGRYLTGHTAAA